jgi:hypothetical protein
MFLVNLRVFVAVMLLCFCSNHLASTLKFPVGKRVILLPPKWRGTVRHFWETLTCRPAMRDRERPRLACLRCPRW